MKKRYYTLLAIGIILTLIGVGMTGKLFAETFATFNGKHFRFTAPSQVEIQLNEEGMYSVYFEYKSYLDNKVFNTEKAEIDKLVLNVRPVGNDAELKLEDLRELNFKGSYEVTTEHKFEAREAFRIITDKPSRIIIDTSESSNEELVLVVRRNYVMESLYELKERVILLVISQVLGLFLVIFSIIKMAHSPKKQVTSNEAA